MKSLALENAYLKLMLLGYYLSMTKLSKKQLLEENKHFCMLPWMHMHILPGSSVIPCCVWPYDKPLGSIKDDSLKGIWNNEAYIDLRKKMLRGEAVENCSQCYEREKSNGISLRRTSNFEWAHHFDDLVGPTLEDGKLKEFKMAYFDVRFSNICNFKCRGCSPELSSAWLTDHEKLYGYKSDKDKLISIMPNENAWNELVGFLPTVERAYFAGGEPLIMDEHYLILEELIKLGKSDVPLSYNSNMSNLRFRNKLVMEYWNKFKHVQVGVSVDDFGSRGEYFRNGMNWEKTVENIRSVKAECPHVIFSINCTVSLFNVSYLPELHAEALKLKLINVGDFFANILIDPAEYRVQVLPRAYREKIAKKLRDYVLKMTTFYVDTDPHGVSKFQFAFQSVINLLLQPDEKENLEKFKDINQRLDKIRGEDFSKTFPELAFLTDPASSSD